MEVVVYGVLYLMLCVISALIFNTNKSRWLKLLLCIVFTPFLAFYILKYLQRKSDARVTHYICTRCHLEFTQEAEYCPICKREGIETKLIVQVMEQIQ